MGNIMWLASYPKSGNTWLRAFLHNFLRDPARSYDINALSHFTMGDSQLSWYQQIDPRPPSDYTQDDVRRMRPQVHRAMTQAFPDTVFVKTHNALLLDEGHPLVTMEVTAGAIYIVRNPLDVVVSYSHHLAFTIDQTIDLLARENAASDTNEKNVYEVMGSWSQNVDTWTRTASPQLHVVRYEDLLERPRQSFGGIVRFLGIEAPRDRLDKAIKLSSFRVLKEQEKRNGFIERPEVAPAFFREGRAGQWRDRLTPAQVDRVLSIHHLQMERFGYVPGAAGMAATRS